MGWQHVLGLSHAGKGQSDDIGFVEIKLLFKPDQSGKLCLAQANGKYVQWGHIAIVGLLLNGF